MQTHFRRVRALKPLLFLAIAAILQPTLATVRHVDYTNGADSGDGTAAPGWKTIAYAVANANEGDEIVLAKGTHVCSANIVVDKALHIRGAGENWETVFDADHKVTSTGEPHVKITADGVCVNNLTFYRLCGGNYHNKGLFTVTGNSVVSNCVFTSCGLSAGGDNKLLLSLSKGLLTSCWVTNNVCRYDPLVSLSGSAGMENCVVAKNRNYMNQGNGLVMLYTATGFIRNCTIVENTLVEPQRAFYPQYGAAGTVRAYNNIIYGNTNTLGAAANFGFRRWYANDVVHNDIEGTARGDDGVEYILNAVNPKNEKQYVGKENFSDDPCLNEGFAPTAAASASVKSGAKTGADGAGLSYCTSCDIYGKPRGDKPSMGAIQYFASSSLSAAVNADKTSVSLPAVIALTAVVEGAASENLTYAWDLDGDGEFDDGTESTNVLNKAGTYDAVRVRVSDGVGTATGAYDGVLTVFLDVTVSASATKVKQPNVITFSAVTKNEVTEPLSYSWDLDGDGVEDSTEANPTLSEIGTYVNPTLLCLTDATGLRSDKIVLTGSYVVMPEVPRTFAVDPGDSIAEALTRAFDGDTVVLKKGTHPVTSVLTVERPITICGEGAKEETILDANHGGNGNLYWRFVVAADGARVSNLTFTRFSANSNDGKPGFVCLFGNSVVSNVVVRGCGRDSQWCCNPVDLRAGLFTHSWVTNNVAGDCAGVYMSGDSTMENCAILGNRSTDGGHDQGAALSMPSGSGHHVVRNCTIVGNTFVHTNNAAVYGRAWNASKESVRLYNNIVWGNTCTKEGAVHPNAYNDASQKWFVKNNCWDYEVAAKLQDPDGGKDYGNVNADPKFDAVKGAPRLAADSPCRNAGADAYAPTGVDLFGHPRCNGKHVDIGCAELATAA